MNATVNFDGTFVAAGSVFGYQTDDGVPVVWTSKTNGATWHFAWAPGGVVGSSGSDQLLAVTGNVILLVSFGTPGSVLWRSTDPDSWTRVVLPEWMDENFVTSLTTGLEGEVSAVVQNKGFPGPQKSTWVTADGGLTWTEQ